MLRLPSGARQAAAQETAGFSVRSAGSTCNGKGNRRLSGVLVKAGKKSGGAYSPAFAYFSANQPRQPAQGQAG
jgi:hypothetical protein